MSSPTDAPMSRPHYFPSKRDLWVVLLIWAAAVAIVVIGFERLLAPGPVVGRLLVGAVCLGLAGFTLWVLYTTGYEVTADKLVIHFGPIRRVVDLSAIEEVVPSRIPVSSPALSLDRLRIRYRGGGFGVLVSPEDKRGFLQVLAQRRPDLVLSGDRLKSGVS